VTTDSPEGPLLKISIDLGMEDASLLGGDELYSKDHYMVFLNGQPVGVHRQPVKSPKPQNPFITKITRIIEIRRPPLYSYIY
jgi:hypothetical protein